MGTSNVALLRSPITIAHSCDRGLRYYSAEDDESTIYVIAVAGVTTPSEPPHCWLPASASVPR